MATDIYSNHRIRVSGESSFSVDRTLYAQALSIANSTDGPGNTKAAKTIASPVIPVLQLSRRKIGIILWNRSEEAGANARMTENARRTENVGSHRSGGQLEQREDQWAQPGSQRQTGDARDDVQSLQRCWFCLADPRVG